MYFNRRKREKERERKEGGNKDEIIKLTAKRSYRGEERRQKGKSSPMKSTQRKRLRVLAEEGEGKGTKGTWK